VLCLAYGHATLIPPTGLWQGLRLPAGPELSPTASPRSPRIGIALPALAQRTAQMLRWSRREVSI
jgi:hypothetical protein